ncbi:MAG TPA: hypothetical protein VG276_18380 [Actinomycetes bacterium]|nr:hypothetical protein [Actinomycetes bacterium]
MPECDQVLDGQGRPGLVVDGDAGDPGGPAPADQQRRQAAEVARPHALAGCGDPEEPVDPPRQGRDALGQRTGRHQQRVAGGGRAFPGARGHPRQDCVAQVGDDHADGHGPLGLETAGSRVGLVVQPPGGVQDPLAGLRPDGEPAVAGEHARHHRRVDASQLGDVLEPHLRLGADLLGCHEGSLSTRE